MSYDIHFQILTPDQQAGSKPFGFGFLSAVGVRGPQKMVNRWAKCFMTLKGSDPFNRTYGTNFPSLFGSNISNPQDLSDAMAIFIDDCNAQMRSMDAIARPPADETFANATLAGFIPTVAGDGFDAYIFIQNAAGIQLQVGLPSIITR